MAQEADLELRRAMSVWNVVRCRKAIADGANVKKMQYEGDAPIHVAAKAGSVEVVRLLIEHGADVKVSNIRGITALHEAAWEGHLDVCRLLLEAGADPNVESDKGALPLAAAGRKGNIDICRLLIGFGARSSQVAKSFEAKHKFLTPFQMMVKMNKLEMVRWFVTECGEDPAQKTIKGKTMMYLAGDSEEMKSLLRSLKTETAIKVAVDASDATQAAPVAKSRGMSPL